MKKGFTIAEVLITIVIIGVIAVITIPIITKNSNDIELRTKWKEIYSIISNATNLIIQDNGGSMKNSYSTKIDIINMYAEKLDVIKKCYNNAHENCWIDLNKKINFLNGPHSSYIWRSHLANNDGFILKNGAFVTISSVASLASPDCTGNSTGSLEDKICIYFLIDVNGFKAPNCMGKDIYVMYIHETKVKPYTTVAAVEACKPSAQGWGCSSRWLYSSDYE